jgi:hypothetical protein
LIRLLPAALVFLAVLPAFSQGADTLDTRIQGIEKKLAATALPPEERGGALLSLARLLELSGDMEGAAGAWYEAVRVLAGPEGILSRDGAVFLDNKTLSPEDKVLFLDNTLLRSASCFAALGEFGRAGAIARALSERKGPGAKKARFLSAQIEALKSGRTDILRSLLADPAYGDIKPRIYYSLLKIEGDRLWRKRLIDEYPQSPEALIAAGTSSPDPSVSASPTALWLFMGAEPPVSGAAAVPPADREEETRLSAGAPVPLEGRPPEGPPPILQTGIFSREENAKTLAEKMGAAGFTPVITVRTLNGNSYWAVGVRPGEDYNRTILLLKNAGFEAFPVF